MGKAQAPAQQESRLDVLVLRGGQAKHVREVLSVLANGVATAHRVEAADEWRQGELGKPGVILICGMTGDDAATLACTIHAESPAACMVVVVASVSQRELRDLLAAGTVGIVSQDDVRQTLETTVDAVSRGLVVVPTTLWQPLARPTLSPREKQALAMVVMGFSNGEIAARLYVTEATVKSHLSSAFAKLGVRSRAQATALILDPNQGLGAGVLAISDGAPRRRRRAGASAAD